MVFTLPAAIAFQNKAAVYTVLFKAVAETLRTIAADPKHLGAEIAHIAVHYLPTSIASCLVVASPLMESAGSHAGRGSSCPCACCRACFGACSSSNCRRPMTKAG
ncbi:hypothetical protein AJ88_28885 [Mesorhizobium amorphae CCBAU 01583]|nr:hypothetical protein AJ88_28885 [Mesorhizobium amorphae CCBAU 01583]